MKITSILVLLLLLSSCSSPEKQTESTDLNKKEEAVIEETSNTDTEELIPEKQVDKNQKKQLYAKLNRAYTNRNSKLIRSTVSELLAQNSKDRIALMALGSHYFRSGAFGMSKLIWGRALTSNPNDSALLNNLGLVALKEKDESLAINYFKNAIRNNPDSLAANINLGLIYLKYKNYRSSNLVLEKAYRMSRKSHILANNYALSLRGVGDFQGSIKVYENGLNMKPNKREILLNYGALLILTKQDVDKGLKLLEQARLLTTDKVILKYISNIIRLAR